jgi:hypothetical protein
MICRNSASNDYAAKLQANSDTGSNYRWHFLSGNGSAASAGDGGTNNTYMQIGYPLTLNSSTANAFGVAIIDILDYANTNKYKTMRSLNGYDVNGSGFARFNSGYWGSTNAITSLTIGVVDASDSYATYSSFALYGVK